MSLWTLTMMTWTGWIWLNLADSQQQLPPAPPAGQPIAPSVAVAPDLPLNPHTNTGTAMHHGVNTL